MEVRKQIKLAFCWLWLILLTVMLVFSIYFVALGFTGDREEKITSYENAVDTWNDDLRPQFQQLHMLLYEKEASRDTHLELMETYHEVHDYPLDHDRYGKLPDYDVLFYQSTGEASKYGLHTVYDYSPANLTFVIELRDDTETNFLEYYLEIPPVPIFKKQVDQSSVQRSCDQKKGYFDSLSRTCTTFWKIVGICVKISKNDDTKQYELNDEWDSVGCNDLDMEIAQYRKMEGILSEADFGKGVHFQNFTSIVRSAYDPLMEAEEVTEGTFNFGLSSRDWKVVGFILLISCILLITQPIFYIHRKCKHVFMRNFYEQTKQYDLN